MIDDSTTDKAFPSQKADNLKNWVMSGLTLLFVLLYVGALFGLVKPLADTSLLTRLEPILFVIIGYYFGRLPAQANETALKNEIERQSQKADAALQIKEKSQQEREILEEKIKNARLALSASHNPLITEPKDAAFAHEKAMHKNPSLETAIKILNS